jgi:hypothetical protein
LIGLNWIKMDLLVDRLENLSKPLFVDTGNRALRKLSRQKVSQAFTKIPWGENLAAIQFVLQRGATIQLSKLIYTLKCKYSS